MGTNLDERMRTYDEDAFLMLSGIQHFYFCKRQWALIHVEQQWAENQATMEGNYLHERADDPFLAESRKKLLISRAVPISSRFLGLSGILDVLEFYQDEGGVAIPGKTGLWRPHIVEYKHGKPKKDLRDQVQLTAQVMCLEEQYHCKITQSAFYYHTGNRRQTVLITEELRRITKQLADEMHEIYQTGKTPKAEIKKNCQRCSLCDLCMPRLTKRKSSVNRYMQAHLAAQEEVCGNY